MKKAQHNSVKDLSQRLHDDVLRFKGKSLAAVPHFRKEQLIPVVVIAVAAAVLLTSGKARNSLWVKMAMMFSSHLLQQDASDDLHDS